MPWPGGMPCHDRWVSDLRDADRGRSTLRLAAMAVCGLIAGGLVGIAYPWWDAAVAGWAGACATYIVWVWLVVAGLDADGTRAHATREDPGRRISDWLVLLASLASLGAVAVLLISAAGVHGANRLFIGGLSLASVALSWTLVHTLYMLRYARVYYAEPVGGIDFNNPQEPPRYLDFAYLAFDLGMTYQVSDTTLRSSRLRAIVLRHTLLSYVFGTVVLATTISLVVGLASG